MKKKDKLSKYEYIQEIQTSYEKESDKVIREQKIIIITPTDEESIDDV